MDASNWGMRHGLIALFRGIDDVDHAGEMQVTLKPNPFAHNKRRPIKTEVSKKTQKCLISKSIYVFRFREPYN